MSDIIEIINLSKSFIPFGFIWQKKKVIPALNNINLKIKGGECFALLGPNGAGKTTLIKIICSLILPDKGEVKIAGYDLSSQEKLAKTKIGLVTGEERSFYWRLTGRQNLEFFSAFYNLPLTLAKKRINELAELFGISEQLDIRFQEYSAGVKQKMAFVRSLLNNPQVLLIDEPTKSLDPISANNLRNFIKEELVTKNRKTVFFVTHLIREAESLADRIAIINRGIIKIYGTLDELRMAAGFPKSSLYEIYVKLINTGDKCS